MKSLLLSPAVLGIMACTLVASTVSSAAVISPGNLVVERLGNGATTLSSTSAPIAVLEVTTSGSLTQTISFPSSGADQQSDSGSATSNGYLRYNAGFVSVSGYNVPPGTASVASGNTKVNSFIDVATGSIVGRTTFPTGGAAGVPPSPFSGNNFRSSIATSGSTFYAFGTSSGSPNTGGAWFYNGSSFVQVSSTATGQTTNMRVGGIFGNQLFASAGSTGTGVWSIGSGLPTTAGNTSTLMINTGTLGTSASPYGFVLFDTNADNALDLAYIADDRNTTGGGLQKWTFDGSSWSNAWTLLVNSSTNTLQSGAASGFSGLRGLAGTYDSVLGATLYSTTIETSNNRLISIVDVGSTPSTYSTLQTAGTNFVFRGVDIVSVPEPSMAALAAIGGGLAGLMAWRRRRPRSAD